MRKVGDIVRIRAKAELAEHSDDGTLSFTLSDVSEVSKDLERTRLAEKAGILADEELDLIFDGVV